MNRYNFLEQKIHTRADSHMHRPSYESLKFPRNTQLIARQSFKQSLVKGISHITDFDEKSGGSEKLPYYVRLRIILVLAVISWTPIAIILWIVR